jgi:hypothetical protein
VLLTAASGGSLGSPASASITIVADMATAVSQTNFSFSESAYSIKQSAGKIAITVNKTGSAAASVRYSTKFGTALDGIDYINTYGTMTWAAGNSSPQTFTVSIRDSKALTANRSLSVLLSDANNGSIVSPSAATITILADMGSTVQFAPATYTVARNAGYVQLTVARTGGAASVATAQYTTQPGTALSGTDFGATSGTLTWPSSDTSSRSIVVPILDPDALTASRQFTVALTEPGANVSIGASSSAKITILPTGSTGSPPPVGNLELASSNVAVSQSAGSASVLVNRTGGSEGAVSVAYKTTNGTAVAGTNYTATASTLSWANGDAAAKSISIPISTSEPFTGSKSFSVSLSAPTGGASISTPSSANVAITGAGSASGGPSAVSNLLLTNQGGPNNNYNVNQDSLSNSQTISWGAATAGANPIAHYQIYRNGVAYATTTALTFTDSNATNSNDVQQNNGCCAFNAPRTVYKYNVAAVDTAGNIGPQASQQTFWQHSDGVDFWGAEAYNPPPPAVIMNWYNTAVAHNGAPSTVSVTTDQSSQYLQPFSAPPSVPLYSFEAGAFANGYMQFDVYPTKAGQLFKMNLVSRVTIGDLYNNAQVFNIGSNPAYGPVPLVQNAWNHIKIPMGAGTASAPGLQMGIATFQGYISGTVLTVTSISNQIQVNASMWISAPGMTTDYIASTGSGSGTTGTYNMNVSQNVGSAAAPVTFTGQRTNLYKWGLQDSNESGPNLWYLDNIGYTTN